jgi:hypothetical protein
VSIHRAKQDTYEVKWRGGAGQPTKNCKTKAEATALQADVDRRLAGGKPVMRRKDVPTLQEFADQWLASRTDLEDSTLGKYAEWLGVHIYPDLGHLPLLDLRPHRLAEWQYDRLNDGAGPAVLVKAQGLLGRFLTSPCCPMNIWM